MTRIPFDSESWERPEMGNTLERLEDLLAQADIDSTQVCRFISSFDRTGDEMEPEFFPTIPYLLDLFETHPSKLNNGIISFCGSLIKPSGPPSDECWEPVLEQRERIGKVLLQALNSSRPESELAIACIAGLAAVYTSPDDGLQMYRHSHFANN